MPSGQENVNTELFKDKTELATRAGSLKAGMKEKAVFEKIGIRKENFERMSVPEVQMALYGNSQVRGTPAQLEQFRKSLSTCQGYALPYRKIDASHSLGFGKLKLHKKGYDLKLVLIFRNGRLLRSTVEGTENVRMEEDQYLWQTLLRKGIGLAF